MAYLGLKVVKEKEYLSAMVFAEAKLMRIQVESQFEVGEG